jgi:hypothetical protein
MDTDSKSPDILTAKSAKSAKLETNSLCSLRRAKALFQRDGGCVLPPTFYYGATSAAKIRDRP